MQAESALTVIERTPTEITTQYPNLPYCQSMQQCTGVAMKSRNLQYSVVSSKAKPQTCRSKMLYTIQEEPLRFSSRYQKERFGDQYCSQCDSAQPEWICSSVLKILSVGSERGFIERGFREMGIKQSSTDRVSAHAQDREPPP